MTLGKMLRLLIRCRKYLPTFWLTITFTHSILLYESLLGQISDMVVNKSQKIHPYFVFYCYMCQIHSILRLVFQINVVSAETYCNFK
jgi:hypothetical protein